MVCTYDSDSRNLVVSTRMNNANGRAAPSDDVTAGAAASHSVAL